MKKIKCIFRIIIFIFVVFPMFCFASNDHILISEIKISGKTSTDEYIKLYNPLDSEVSLAGYKLVKKTTSGSSYNLISNFSEEAVIAAKSYFLISHRDYVGYGMPYYYSNSSYSISKDNSIYLMDKDSSVVDLIGFGNCFGKEGGFVFRKY